MLNKSVICVTKLTFALEPFELIRDSNIQPLSYKITKILVLSDKYII